MFVVISLICLIVTLVFINTCVAGERVKLYMPDAPPLTLPNDLVGNGMAGDVVLTAIARSGRQAQIIVEPWPRAQVSVIDGKNLLIIPLSRTPEREAHYTWIAPIMVLERAFFSLDSPVSSFAEARQRYRRIGIGLGTAQAEILRREGFNENQVVHLKLGENPARLLELGRIDAWFTGVPEALYIWNRSAYRKHALRMSPALTSTDIYLACSKQCDTQLVEALRGTLEELEQDGVSLRLRQAYLPSIPDP